MSFLLFYIHIYSQLPINLYKPPCKRKRKAVHYNGQKIPLTKKGNHKHNERNYSWETFYERSLLNLSSKKNKQNQEQRDDDGEEEESDGEDSDDDEDSDPGTSWFTEHNAPEKVLQFLTSEKFPLAPQNLQGSSRQPTILDLGTGNGSMLALLRDKGEFKGQMVGVDYSGKSVELARRLWPAEGLGEVRFEEWDILGVSGGDFEEEGKMPRWFIGGGFDIVLDKGTFDAVSLSDETVVEEEGGGGGVDGERKGSRVVQRRVCERYPGIARRLVKKGGFLVVTSCNWTEEELVKWFTGPPGEDKRDGDKLVVWDRVDYPRFKFGGQEGQGVCTVCFKREG